MKNKSLIPTIEELKNSQPIYPFVEAYIEACLNEMVKFGIAEKSSKNEFRMKRQPTESEADRMTAFEANWYAKRGIPKRPVSLN
jgi:hypothetical protein